MTRAYRRLISTSPITKSALYELRVASFVRALENAGYDRRQISARLSWLTRRVKSLRDRADAALPPPSPADEVAAMKKKLYGMYLRKQGRVL